MSESVLDLDKWNYEEYVDTWVGLKLEELGLKKYKDFHTQRDMTDYMKEALKGSSKTSKKSGSGLPDVFLENKYEIPIIMENKLGIKKLVAQITTGIKCDEKSIQNFAVNGAIYYATQMIESKKYSEVIAIGVAGDNDKNVEIKVYYVYGSNFSDIKLLSETTTFDFLENEKSFATFLNSVRLSDEEKHELLIKNKSQLKKYAEDLNKLMHNLNITAPQRVLYVSGMLLSMQDMIDNDGKIINLGLTKEDLSGVDSDTKRDGVKVVNQIRDYLSYKKIPQEKRELMTSSFLEISKDKQRDIPKEPDKFVANLLEGNASTNKQIFTFIYEYIFKSIDSMNGYLDIMGEMYSEFLKYAFGDGKELGIVLTPPYITKLMARLLQIDKDCKVMDLATGSAGFLISAMSMMIENAEECYGKNTTKAQSTIADIKKKQLLGIELNAEMFTLASTNMILRGDGSSNIKKGDAFNRPNELYESFKANRVLLNPPFSYKENGMPFIEYGLSKMQENGIGAIIIQDSAGSGKAINTNKQILKHHSLLASIKMPQDLFQPSAGVQTSIYIFKAHVPHDYEKPVKFIDFRNDGYKRTERGIREIDNPTKRYEELIKIYKAGKNAQIDTTLWNIEDVYVEDFITDNGNDWNFDQHKKIDTIPTEQDFKKTVADYLSWKVSTLLKEENSENF